MTPNSNLSLQEPKDQIMFTLCATPSQDWRGEKPSHVALVNARIAMLSLYSGTQAFDEGMVSR